MIYDEDFQELMKCIDSLKIFEEIGLINARLMKLNNTLNKLPELINEKESRLSHINNLDKILVINEHKQRINTQINYLKDYKKGLFNGIEIIQRSSY